MAAGESVEWCGVDEVVRAEGSLRALWIDGLKGSGVISVIFRTSNTDAQTLNKL
jgi:hypothetical protein